jgi:hypothetical protein
MSTQLVVVMLQLSRRPPGRLGVIQQNAEGAGGDALEPDHVPPRGVGHSGKPCAHCHPAHLRPLLPRQQHTCCSLLSGAPASNTVTACQAASAVGPGEQLHVPLRLLRGHELAADVLRPRAARQPVVSGLHEDAAVPRDVCHVQRWQHGRRVAHRPRRPRGSSPQDSQLSR